SEHASRVAETPAGDKDGSVARVAAAAGGGARGGPDTPLGTARGPPYPHGSPGKGHSPSTVKGWTAHTLPRPLLTRVAWRTATSGLVARDPWIRFPRQATARRRRRERRWADRRSPTTSRRSPASCSASSRTPRTG